MTSRVVSVRTVDDHGTTYQALMFVCPGCAAPSTLSDGRVHTPTGIHMLPVNTTVKSPQWDWNGDEEHPTLSPSILTRTIRDGVDFVCHSFLRDGVFEFLTDSTHTYAGQSVPIPPLPDWSMFDDD